MEVVVMKKIVMFLVGAALVIFGVTSMAQDYEHEVTSGDMSFAWKIDGDTLHGKMSAPTKGWVAVGFNPSNAMKDANFILGYVKGDEVTVVDHHGIRNNAHASDEKEGGAEDVTVVGGSEEGGTTTIEFTFPLKSGDSLDGELVPDGDTILLMAYGSDRDSFRVRHTYNAEMTVNLATGATK
jgi:hypothetical protein